MDIFFTISPAFFCSRFDWYRYLQSSRVDDAVELSAIPPELNKIAIYQNMEVYKNAFVDRGFAFKAEFELQRTENDMVNMLISVAQPGTGPWPTRSAAVLSVITASFVAKAVRIPLG